VSTLSVSTNCVVSADVRILRTLIDIGTRAVSLGSETLGASTIADTASDGDAFGSIWTLFALGAAGENAISTHQLIWRLALALGAIALFAKVERISVEACGACAFVASGEVLTNGIDATGGLVVLIALIDVAATLGHGVARVSLAADAHVGAASVGHALFSDGARVLIVTLH
jgi:hypothetical protein